MKLPKDLTYEQATARLEEIVSALERNTLELDRLSDHIREAQDLLAFCRKKLDKVENEVNKTLNHEQK